MKKRKVLGNIFFWMTLISPVFSFVLISKIGEVNIFGVAGIVRYSWIMWLFIPVGVISVIIGLKLKRSNQKCKKNFIISFVCIPLLIIFGSYRLVFNSVSYDVDEVFIIEDKIKINLPDDIKVATNKLDLYEISYVKIISYESKKTFEQEIKNNQLWQNELNPNIKSLLPIDIQYESETFDYFIFYNATNDEYNKNPMNGNCEIVFIAYDSALQRLIILNDYTVNYN
jgi:hypothetical protein